MKGNNPAFTYISTNSSTAVDNVSIETPIKEISSAGKKLLLAATSADTKDIIKQLYRPGASIGDGGTADALRYEKSTGQNFKNKSHMIKATERAAQIRKILSKKSNHPDRVILEKLLSDLEDAINGGKL